MARIQPVLKIELDPSNPVQEVCTVIASVTQFHPDQETDILQGIQKAIDDRLNQVKEVDLGGTKSLRKSSRL